MKELSTMMGYYGGMGWGGWILMALVMLVFWGLVIFAVVALFRGIGRDTRQVDSSASRGDALDILRQRFARGEIDAEEYHARAEVLREGGRDTSHAGH